MPAKKHPGSVCDQLQGDAKKPRNPDATARSQCVQFFTRMSQGCYARSSTSDTQVAKTALAAYQDYSMQEKTDFAAQFQKNKGKGFGWVKTFTDALTTKKRVDSSAVEKYCNRIACA